MKGKEMVSKKRLLATVIVLILVLGLSGEVFAAKKSENQNLNRYIIKFEKDVSRVEMQRIVKNAGGTVIRELKMINGAVVLLPDKAADSFKRARGVRSVTIDHVVHATGEVLPWGVDRVDAELVWDNDGNLAVDPGANAGNGTKVCILDTGIDYDHPDLADNYAGGYDFVNNDPDPMDDNGHGTHVAGIVAAVDNDIGVIGVAPEARLYAVKVLDESGAGYESDVVAGVEWCINNGAQIISMSLGSDSDLPALHEALDEAYYNHSILNVAAAGNDGNKWGTGDTVDYPARYDSVIAVGATDENDNRAVWNAFTASSTGLSLELAAPGDGIYSTYLDDTYATLSGTSMACPHVTGVAALVFAGAVDPAYDLDDDGVWDANEVRKRLQDTAEDLGDPGWDEEFGYGLVDADAAVYVAAHDVAVTGITAPSWVVQGNVVNISVDVANEGNYDESFNVTLTDTTDSTVIGIQSVSLAAGNSTTITFSWNTTYASLGDHILEARAEEVENETDTADNSKNTTVTVTEANTMHVGDIIMSSASTGRGPWTWYKALATVLIVDASGKPVDGAVVESHWSGAYSEDVSGTTGADGKVTFETRWVKGGGTFTFTVDNVTKEGWIYDSSANVETSDSITVP